jgi:hypothetical protein
VATGSQNSSYFLYALYILDIVTITADSYARPTWEPASAMEDTAALDDYEKRLQTTGREHPHGQSQTGRPRRKRGGNGGVM